MKDHQKLLQELEARFEKHPQRHAGTTWATVRERLEASSAALHTLERMEATGGEPDVVRLPSVPGGIVFCDCSPESPGGRRSTCYDRKARTTRKEHAPASSAAEMADEIGIRLLTEKQYRELQQLGEFDRKTSSWVATPDDVRALGGAMFCDRRYGRVWVYHNGAQSYYAARGFRGLLQL
jgi:hypothetical protein